VVVRGLGGSGLEGPVEPCYIAVFQPLLQRQYLPPRILLRVCVQKEGGGKDLPVNDLGINPLQSPIIPPPHPPKRILQPLRSPDSLAMRMHVFVARPQIIHLPLMR
jgi:hypothetical protein